jgi:hypothetical protein
MSPSPTLYIGKTLTVDDTGFNFGNATLLADAIPTINANITNKLYVDTVVAAEATTRAAADTRLEGLIPKAMPYLFLSRKSSDTYTDSNQYVNFDGFITTNSGFIIGSVNNTINNGTVITPPETGIYFITCWVRSTSSIGSPLFEFTSSVSNTRIAATPSLSYYGGIVEASFIVSLTNVSFSLKLTNSATFVTGGPNDNSFSAALSIFRIG